MEIEIVKVSPEDLTRVQQITTDLLGEMNGVDAIKTDQEYELAASLLKNATGVRSNIMDVTQLSVASAHAAHGAAKKLQNYLLEPVDIAISRFKKLMSVFVTEKNARALREQQEAQRKLQEAAARIAEEKRLALEAAAKAQAARGQAEAAAALATQAANMQVVVPKVAPVVSEDPKVQGVSTRTVWKWEVIDSDAIPREYLMINDQKIGAVVRACGDGHNIAGIRAWPEQTIATRK